MKLSHSKLNTILSCPMTYYLQYKLGILPKVEKAALSIGSAVHWGIEHETEDLTEYFGDRKSYGRDQLLAEAMVHGYLKHKDEIFEDFLTDKHTKEKVELLDETHEIYINGKLKSLKHIDPHIFVGIIDLLLLTNKGWIIIDYKTSTYSPNWEDYLDQIYRYIFLLRTAFPDVPVYKCGIINLKKTGIKQKKSENDVSFLNRMKLEYDINDENYVNWHEYLPEELDSKLLDNYIDNLSKQADFAEVIDENSAWFINFGAANGKYGKSQYWDIFYKTDSCHVLYSISDTILDNETNILTNRRDCRPTDMMLIDSSKRNILYQFEQYNAQALAYYSIHNDIDKDEFHEFLRNSFIVDDELLELYWNTLLYTISNEKC